MRRPSVGVRPVVRHTRQRMGSVRLSSAFLVHANDPFAGVFIFPISEVQPLVQCPPVRLAPRFQLRPACSIAKIPIPHFARHLISLV